jgi:maleylpyruvate isomerase
MSGIPGRSLAWLRAGTDRLLSVVDGMPDGEFARPSLLPSWTRGTLIAHLALNAGALGNLVAWARTGVESPMYASTEQRAADIARLGAAPASVVRAEFLAGATRLTEDLATLPDACWAAPVRTARGRPIPASEIPWMRNREVWVHAVDLDAGLGFGDVPPDVLAALLDDAAALMSARPEARPVAARSPDGREWHFGPAGVPPETTVTADLPDLCAWALGRREAPGAKIEPTWPQLPEWL